MNKRKLPTSKNAEAKNNLKLRIYAFTCVCAFFCLFVFALSHNFNVPTKVHAEEEKQNALENALFERQEFFGAEAIVPLPTAQARENIAGLVGTEPDNPQFLEKLAELNERLNDFDEAERILIRLAEIDRVKLENLAAFYDRRTRFERKAEVLRQILSTTDVENRAGVFERLINFAKTHDLKEYLQKDFYAQVAKENPNVYAIYEKLTDDFIVKKNYAEALSFVREAKVQFPKRQSVLLEKEVDILLEMRNPKEAEAVYQAAFDPLWSDAEAEKFYDFLNNQDRLRAYGAELKKRFKQNPADFDVAVRLALYQNHDYSYGNDEITPVILQLEQAKNVWTTEELIIVTRLLLKENEAETASRFLYTLYVREDFKADSQLRAKILYQLFEMFSDAENQKLPITKGDLRFYEDVAKTDTSPGIATGILSLIFSDTNPKERLDEQEKAATKYFNRAAAYRIFLSYKEEFPSSTELAQMYLDVVRLYTATKEPEIAEAALNEFAQKYENSSDYPAAALKLADAFIAANNAESERKIYQKVLDYLGKQGKFHAPQIQYEFQIPSKFGTHTTEAYKIADEKMPRNSGINIPEKEEKTNYYDWQPESAFHDYLARKDAPITYSEVLEKLVASFAKEKKTTEILALYSNEIQKYPNEEWLYEQRLSWLEQTNLTEDQLQAYQSALARFGSRGWQDKVARWFLRQKRQTDFAEFSQDLVGKLKDTEIEDYLSQFIDGKVSTDFEKQLFLKLYQTAHERFPHNTAFVEGLLRFYKTNKQTDEWRKIAARYFFESKNIRVQFIENLAEKGELRSFLTKAGDNTIYELFRAEASERLSNYKDAIRAHRKLNQIYPNAPEFSEKLVSLTRSFGQKNRDVLSEAASLARQQADFMPSSAELRTRSGEIYAELGLYDNARQEWEKLIPIAAGEKEIYLDAATVYWDYFQYDDALRAIKTLREKFTDQTLYTFETGAILEAQHKQTEAIAEYVRALDATGVENETQKEKAQRRLVSLVASDGKVFEKIEAAFQTESRKKTDSSFLALGYAEFLGKIKQEQKADRVLGAFVRQSGNKEFLEAAKDFYQSAGGNELGEQMTLKRLTEIEEIPRRKIGYSLQLAESFEESRNRNAARNALTELVNKFPTNYGVLDEASDFYYRLGFENESVAVLQNALARSRGRYRNALAAKLASRLIRLNRLDSAEQVLLHLHDEDKANTEIFNELSKVYVQTGKAELLRVTFAKTVAALKQSDADRRELSAQIADLREQMIGAFTRLKDYNSAVEQHIEIINREPEDEELIENAISYVQRYGGVETLLNYYLKTSAQSFKNYRWNVVLARIYEAKNDWDNAIKNYEAAIVNQPEMVELYVALADLQTKGNNFDEALKNLDTVLELTNDAPEYVKKKIAFLKKAGRFAEVEIEQAKLPVEENPKVSTNQFAKARKLGADEKEKSRELYHQAFRILLENPTGGELKAADVSGYVQAVRQEEPLNQINEGLWQLREKLIEKADETNATDAGEARKRISILDGALTESIGIIAKTVATDEELAALHMDLERRIEEIVIGGDPHQSLSLIQDMSRRSGLGDLEERILRKKLESANLSADRQIHLQNLVNFYNERGAYQKTFDALEQYQSDNLPLRAETARVVNNREKELEALRAIYWKGDKISTVPDANVARYLEILYAENPEELESLTQKSSSPHQLQLINFLLGKGSPELAHSAIESANLPPVWKFSRHAETSLVLKESGETAACYFCDALQIDPIGSLVEQKPDKKQSLINDDWFRLSREYGEWLFENKEEGIPPAKFLASMIENQPRNDTEQSKLGEFYLNKGEPKSAIEHFRLAVEMKPDDKQAWANLGVAYYAAGKTDWAGKCWSRVIEDERVKSGLVLFQALHKYRLSGQAREKLPAVIVKFLQENDAEQSEDLQNLIRAVSASFKNESEKSAYFLRILSHRLTDTSLAEMLINESLIGKNAQHEFYALLINRTDSFSSYDYDYNFTSVAARAWTTQDAESIYEQENDYKTEEPDNKHYEWQKKYLGLLIEQHENQRAEQLIKEIEKGLSRRYARPASLRLAKINIQIRNDNFDLPQIERFVGISASDSAPDIKPPSLERFNDILQILKNENRQAEARQISESFFARNLALEQFDTINFTGLSQIFFQKGETEKALRILQLMADAGDEAKGAEALAEISALDIVKARAADSKKLSDALKVSSTDQATALKIAAETAAKFQQPEAAISFRKRLFELNLADASNQIELAKLMIAKGEKAEAASLLMQIIGNRNSLRSARWQAKMILHDGGIETEIADTKIDSLSQFYNGTLAEKNGENETAINFFLNSLIAEKDLDTSARQELIKLYAQSNQPFAALKLSETVKSVKSDELLQKLSVAAESIGDFSRAIDFEKEKSTINGERIAYLQQLNNEKNRKATNFTIDLENTRKL